jgi:hypothetical protein
MLTVLEAIKSYWIILKHIKTPLYLVKSPFPIHMWSRSWPVYRCGTCRLFPLGSWYDRVLNKFWLWLEKHMLVWSNKFMIANNKTLHLIHGWWCEWIYIYISMIGCPLSLVFANLSMDFNPATLALIIAVSHCIAIFGLKFRTQENEQHVHS